MPDAAELRAYANIQRWRASPATMVRELFHVQPDPWQEEALELYPKCPRLALKASKGPGKAQPNHTLIWGPDGVKTFGSLHQGDLVFAGDGSVTTVRAIYERGVLPIYRIWFDDNSSTQVCGEHLWKVRGDTERRHDTWSILTTDEIITRGVRNKNGRWAGRHFEIPRQGPLQFSHVELPVDPYVIGIWIGDGVRLGGKYATKPTHEIQVEIERRGYRTSGPSGGIVAVHGIIGELRGLGLLPLYSYERFIPKPYLQASVAQRTDLICGLLDTDGGIDADGHMEFSTTSEMLVENFIWLARSLGGNAFRKNAVKKPFYYGQNRQKVMGRDCYRITVRLPFNPFRVPHRRSRWTDPTRSPSTLRYLTRKIDRIEPAGFAECRCIEVDHPDSLYLTDDALIVTHNTACLSWIAWNFLLTRPQPKVLATSISGDNLADGMWTEMDKWRGKSPLLQKHFEWTKTRIYHKGQYETTWWMAARQWSQSADKSQQANTLAGMHADYILFLLDESGGIPDPVMVTAEAALSSCVEGHIVQAGNPTHLSGPLYRAVNLERALWKVVEISGDPDDPKRSTRISMQWAQDMIKTWGRDHPYVLVNVLGRFPPSSFNSLIGPDEVRDAQKRFYRDFEIGNAPKVLGVDVALFGDDQSVIAFRQGLQMLNFKKYRNLQPSMGASIVSREWEEYGAVAAFVDATGGAGSGWVDGLMLLGRAPIGVQFSGHAHENQRYANKRAEMYFDLVAWIKRGGALPPDDNLLAQLTATTYTYEKRGDRFLIEPKEMVKAKLNGNSPDEADAAALTHAEPVTAADQRGRPRFTAEYNPFESVNKGAASSSRHTSEYDPYRIF